MRSLSFLTAALLLGTAAVAQTNAPSAAPKPTTARDQTARPAPIAPPTASPLKKPTTTPTASPSTPVGQPAPGSATSTATPVGQPAPGTRAANGKPAPKPKPIPGTKDGVTIKDGQTMVTEFGSTRFLTDSATVKLTSGMVVKADGTVTRPDGTSVKLVEGDYVSLSGRLMTMKMKLAQDSTRKAEAKQRKLDSHKKKKGLFGR